MPDPCALLTVGDVEAATGMSFDEEVFNDDLSSETQGTCEWFSTGEFAFVQIVVVGIDSYDSNRASADEILGVTDVEIPGVSAAYVTTEGSVIGTAMGSSFLQVSYIPSGPGTVLQETTQLATIAAANFP